MRDQTANQTLGWKKIRTGKNLTKIWGKSPAMVSIRRAAAAAYLGRPGRSGPPSLIWLEISPVAEAETAFEHSRVAMSHLPRNFFKIPLLSDFRLPPSGLRAPVRVLLLGRRRCARDIFMRCLARSRSSRPSGCLRQATRPAPAGTCSGFRSQPSPFCFPFAWIFRHSRAPKPLKPSSLPSNDLCQQDHRE